MAKEKETIKKEEITKLIFIIPVVLLLMILSAVGGWYIGDQGIISSNKTKLDQEIKELTLEEKKTLEFDKLRKALKNAGYVETSEDNYTKEVVKTDKPDGTFDNWDIYYFDVDDLRYSRITAMDALRISTNSEYSIRTNIASGSTQFFEENSNAWEDRWQYTYDFNSGLATCTAIFAKNCSDTSLISFKNSLDSFLSKNNIDVELLK